ncbi:UNVERIFIED_CONTAM: hypothetical protein Sradi_4451000 [Sesamum radiatum]|uniref:Uncharacterized protein n=1 Tax=Sesamum radiatum TaxID=300843 RepID=A0AAW2NTA0_SESRA
MGEKHRLSTSEDSNNSITAQASHVHVVIADEERELEASPAKVSIQIIPSSTESLVRRRIHKVPRPLRMKNEHVYDPVVLSLGPYHHGRTQFRQMEEFKAEILNRFVSDSAAKDKGFFYNKILERIDEIRSYYEEDSTAVFSDEALAEMILLDACFTIYYLQSEYRDYHRLGTAVVSSMFRDFLMLENQIRYGLLTQIPWDNGDEPLYVLEARHRMILLGQEKATESEGIRDLDSRRKELRQRISSQRNMFKMATSQFRSVTDPKQRAFTSGLVLIA